MGGGGGGVAESEGQQLENNRHHPPFHHRLFRQVSSVVLLFGIILVTSLVLYRSSYPFQVFPWSFSSVEKTEGKLKGVLEKADMGDKTVIITTLNGAWAAPNSMFDVFLESFRIGNQTERLLKHLVVIAFDQKAYDRCLALHPHCFSLNSTGEDVSGEAAFMSHHYLDMMWTRILFLHSVLTLGYSFIFTDTDIMWFRDPFPHFYSDADFQIACDYFWGNPSDLHNSPNGGFNYVKSNKHTINFYKFWYTSRVTYPGLHDQDVLNKIKFDPLLGETGMKMKFLDTKYFGGFCQPSHDLNQVCTMHANCCIGLERKVHDLKVMLQDWTNFLALSQTAKASQQTSWTVPQNCSLEPLGLPH